MPTINKAITLDESHINAAETTARHLTDNEDIEGLFSEAGRFNLSKYIRYLMAEKASEFGIPFEDNIVWGKWNLEAYVAIYKFDNRWKPLCGSADPTLGA